MDKHIKQSADNYCYYNGDLVRYKDFKVHISDLSLQRGYGIFDFFRARNGELPWIDAYVERLFNSIALADLDLKISKDDFIRMVHRLHEKNALSNGAFKAIVTGGLSDNLAVVSGNADIFLLNVPWTRPPAATYKNGVQLLTYNYGRPEPEIKTLNYFHTLRLRKKMQEIGAVDLLYHREVIYEASRANLFFVKEGEIFTPGEGMLKGITRKQVLELFPEVKIQDIAFNQLFDFDEVFMSSTSRDITPIIGVNGKLIGNGQPGPVTKAVLSTFNKMGW